MIVKSMIAGLLVAAAFVYGSQMRKGYYNKVKNVVNKGQCPFGKPEYSITLCERQQSPGGVSDICLGCICEAISDCNITTQCNGDTCGLFRITWPYWSDGGKPVLKFDNPEDPGAYQRCVTDPGCAAAAVSGYMARFGQDCNNDGQINCWDYAAIHKLGGYNCRTAIDPVYWGKFTNCQQQVASLGLGGSN